MPVLSQTTCTVAIANPQADVGKTTIAINLAASLFKLGHACLLVDLDHDAQATRALGVRLTAGAHSVYAVMRGLSPFAESYLPTLAGIDLLPGHLDLVLLETPAFAATRSVRQLLDSHEVMQHYDYVVLDCPSALNLRVLDALAIADEVLVPFRVDKDDLPPCQVLALLAEILPGLSVRPVANRVREGVLSRPAASQEFAESSFDYWLEIHYSSKLLKRSLHGLPAVVRWPTDEIAREFTELAFRLRETRTSPPEM